MLPPVQDIQEILHPFQNIQEMLPRVKDIVKKPIMVKMMA